MERLKGVADVEGVEQEAQQEQETVKGGMEVVDR